jgi:predicted DNA-binding protein
MAMSDTVTGAVIGGGAALAAGIVAGTFALLLDSRRRQWEDARRWDDVRRKAYVDFISAARGAYRTFDGLVRFTYDHMDQHKRIEAARQDPEKLSNIEKEIQQLQPQMQEIDTRFDELKRSMQRFEQAYVEISLISSRPVQAAAEAHLEVIRAFGNSQHDAIRRQLRLSFDVDELARRQGETMAAFVREVAEELRVEPRDDRFWRKRKERSLRPGRRRGIPPG